MKFSREKKEGTEKRSQNETASRNKHFSYVITDEQFAQQNFENLRSFLH